MLLMMLQQQCRDYYCYCDTKTLVLKGLISSSILTYVSSASHCSSEFWSNSVLFFSAPRFPSADPDGACVLRICAA